MLDWADEECESVGVESGGADQTGLLDDVPSHSHEIDHISKDD